MCCYSKTNLFEVLSRSSEKLESEKGTLKGLESGRSLKDIFQEFGCKDIINYSKITDYAEIVFATKGNLRNLTEHLMKGTLSTQPTPQEVITCDNVSTELCYSRNSSANVIPGQILAIKHIV